LLVASAVVERFKPGILLVVAAEVIPVEVALLMMVVPIEAAAVAVHTITALINPTLLVLGPVPG
jgi:hypothetical protein